MGSQPANDLGVDVEGSNASQIQYAGECMFLVFARPHIEIQFPKLILANATISHREEYPVSILEFVVVGHVCFFHPLFILVLLPGDAY
jgi:hypothetical protein